MIHETQGNIEILKQHKTAFFCSCKVPSSIVLTCYDWAIAQRKKGNSIISGFHSQLEKDELHYLLKGKQPTIITLARGLKQKLESEFQKFFEQGQLIIITTFNKRVKRVTEQTAATRNKRMIELADNITVGHISVWGNLKNY